MKGIPSTPRYYGEVREKEDVNRAMYHVCRTRVYRVTVFGQFLYCDSYEVTRRSKSKSRRTK